MAFMLQQSTKSDKDDALFITKQSPLHLFFQFEHWLYTV